MAALAQGAVSPPNLVMIYADDLGYGDLGCYGHPTIRTPNLDRMAREGMRFTQYYSGAPICTPSRAALLTGRLPQRVGLPYVLGPRSKGGIQDTELLLSEALKQRGYRTACVGKWHLGHLPQYLPTKHGFDRYFGIPYSNDMSPKTNPNPNYDGPPTPLLRDGAVVEEEPDQTKLTARYTQEAVQFIGEAKQAKKPFFLYFPHTFPHVPLFASEKFRGKSQRGLYGDVVEELDWSVGQVLGALKAQGLDQNTLVCFSSDNGPWLVKEQEAGSSGPLREGKHSTWEGGQRVPFIARFPGRIQPGQVTAEQATSMDVFPSFVKLAGGSLPQDREYDGRDLAPVWFEGKTRPETPFYYYFGEALQAVRLGPWKMHIQSTAPASKQPKAIDHDPPLLYHLYEDAGERYDVAAKHPEIVAKLKDVMATHVARFKAAPVQR